jgi:hypothetical protein
VPLAYVLDDARLKDQVHTAADKVLSLQQSDGWLGPENSTMRTFWARYPLCLGLMNLADANDTWASRVTGALNPFMDYMHTAMQNNYTDYTYKANTTGLEEIDFSWGRVRYADMMIVIMWMLEKNNGSNSQTLIDNMNFLYNGSMKWEDWYNGAVYIKEDLANVLHIPTDNNPLYPYEHGVNVGQGMMRYPRKRGLVC